MKFKILHKNFQEKSIQSLWSIPQILQFSHHEKKKEKRNIPSNTNLYIIKLRKPIDRPISTLSFIPLHHPIKSIRLKKKKKSLRSSSDAISWSILPTNRTNHRSIHGTINGSPPKTRAFRKIPPGSSTANKRGSPSRSKRIKPSASLAARPPYFLLFFLSLVRFLVCPQGSLLTNESRRRFFFHRRGGGSFKLEED